VFTSRPFGDCFREPSFPLYFSRAGLFLFFRPVSTPGGFFFLLRRRSSGFFFFPLGSVTWLGFPALIFTLTSGPLWVGRRKTYNPEFFLRQASLFFVVYEKHFLFLAFAAGAFRVQPYFSLLNVASLYPFRSF